MSVVNGQIANQTTFNNAFMSRTAATTQTIAQVALENAEVESGANIANAQRAINKAFEGVGATGEADNTINDYANNNYILDGDNRKVAIEKLDAQLFQTQTDLDADELVLADHETRIDSAELLLINHETRIDAAELTIIDHETRIDAAELTIIDHETRIDAAELTITDHETRIDNLETATMTIGGNKTFSGDVVVQGDFEVQGTLTSINSVTLEVTDQNVLVNNGGTDGSAEGAGLEVERTSGNAGIQFDSTLASKWKIGLIAALYEVVVSGIAQTISGIKDFVSGIKTDLINESTLNAGVTIDGVLIKDNLVDGRDVSVDGTTQDNHIADTTIHFTEASIDHANIQNIGTNTHAQIDTHIADSSIHFTEASIDHANIQNIGTNSHAQIDTHIADVSNPHAVTQTQVGLSNLTNDAQLKRAAGDLNTFTEKLVPVAADILIIEDSADSFNKKKIQVGNLPSAGGGGGGKKTFSMKLNGLYGGTAAFNGVDGLWVAPSNCQITNVYMYQDTPGSGGTTTLDLKVKPFLAGAFTSMFLTTPKMTNLAGSNAWGGVGDVVTGFTAPVFTSFPFAIAAKSAVRMDLIGAQTGSAAGTGIVIEYEEI